MKQFPKNVNDIGNDRCFAILTPKSVYVGGDERSRTNPGHGYPAHTEESWEIELFKTQDELNARIQELNRFYFKDYKVVHLIPAQVETKVSFNFNNTR